MAKTKSVTIKKLVISLQDEVLIIQNEETVKESKGSRSSKHAAYMHGVTQTQLDRALLKLGYTRKQPAL